MSDSTSAGFERAADLRERRVAVTARATRRRSSVSSIQAARRPGPGFASAMSTDNVCESRGRRGKRRGRCGCSDGRGCRSRARSACAGRPRANALAFASGTSRAGVCSPGRRPATLRASPCPMTACSADGDAQPPTLRGATPCYGVLNGAAAWRRQQPRQPARRRRSRESTRKRSFMNCFSKAR